MQSSRHSTMVVLEEDSKGDNYIKCDALMHAIHEANIEACGEMLRGLAEILEEERLLNPAIVDTLEDVRCRLQIVPKVTVPLTKEFAGGVVSVLLGGLLSTVQILHSTSSFEGDDEFDI